MADLSFEKFITELLKDLEVEETEKENETSRDDDVSQQEDAENELGNLFAQIFNVEDVGKMVEESRKAEEKKETALNTLLEVLEEIQKMSEKKRWRVSFDADEIAEFESKNPEFAEATKEGFSEEEVRKIVIDIADYLIENLNLKRLKDSYAIMLLRLSGKLKVSFSNLTGENVYDYLKENGYVDQLQTPEVKKGFIFSEAVETVVKAKTISFNNAVRKTIAKYNSGKEIVELEGNSKFFEIINKLIDLYVENEEEIVDAILKRL